MLVKHSTVPVVGFICGIAKILLSRKVIKAQLIEHKAVIRKIWHHDWEELLKMEESDPSNHKAELNHKLINLYAFLIRN